MAAAARGAPLRRGGPVAAEGVPTLEVLEDEDKKEEEEEVKEEGGVEEEEERGRGKSCRSPPSEQRLSPTMLLPLLLRVEGGGTRGRSFFSSISTIPEERPAMVRRPASAPAPPTMPAEGGAAAVVAVAGARCVVWLGEEGGEEEEVEEESEEGENREAETGRTGLTGLGMVLLLLLLLLLPLPLLLLLLPLVGPLLGLLPVLVAEG